MRILNFTSSVDLNSIGSLDMNADLTLSSERLLLRPWCPEYLPLFAAMNADPEVMAHFPAPLSAEQSDALANRLRQELEQRGWGMWALELRATGEFIGFAGLNPFSDLPIEDGVEIGWRLARAAWGKGYASEAARRALAFAFTELPLQAVDSFTAIGNSRSIAVMERIGMSKCDMTFLHPRVPEDSTLREHVLYRITRDRWKT